MQYRIKKQLKMLKFSSKPSFYKTFKFLNRSNESNIIIQTIIHESQNQSKKSLGLMPNFLPQNGQYKISIFIYIEDSTSSGFISLFNLLGDSTIIEAGCSIK